MWKVFSGHCKNGEAKDGGGETCVFYAHTCCCWCTYGRHSWLVRKKHKQFIGKSGFNYESEKSDFTISYTVTSVLPLVEMFGRDFFRFQSLPPIQDFSFLLESAKRMKRRWNCVRKLFILMLARVEFIFAKTGLGSSEGRISGQNAVHIWRARVYLITKRERSVKNFNLKWTKSGRVRRTIYLLCAEELLEIWRNLPRIKIWRRFKFVSMFYVWINLLIIQIRINWDLQNHFNLYLQSI